VSDAAPHRTGAANSAPPGGAINRAIAVAADMPSVRGVIAPGSIANKK
jgi:hypothetical protein